jgi:hypothetical protein
MPETEDAPSSDACLCRVPLSEGGWNREHLLKRGIDVRADWAGRPSVSLVDAFALHAEKQAAHEAYERARHEREQREEAEARAGAERRRRVFRQAFDEAKRRGRNEWQCIQAGRAAVVNDEATSDESEGR